MTAILETPMTDTCPICEGSGLRVIERAGGLRVAQPCECRVARRAARIIEQARIPKRYAHCTLEDYVPNYGGNNPTLSNALMQARNYVREYVPGGDMPGLLLTGSIGVGKTHLAVGILQALIADRGATGPVLRLSRPAEEGTEQLQQLGPGDGA